MWLARLLDTLRGTYWFLPLLQTLVSVGLAFGVVAIDRNIQVHARAGSLWAYTGGPEGARQVLATIAGSMITVAGVAFSITIVALSLAANQFGPRLLRNFMRDRRNQFVLGTFTATFLYCLLVLRTVRGTEDRHFVPSVAVALGIFFGVASLGVLIYFIHHVATSIQVGDVVQRVTEDLEQAIDRLWPAGDGAAGPIDRAPESGGAPAGDPTVVTSDHNGYVDAIDVSRLVAVAREHDLVVQLERRPGDFVVTGQELLRVWPPDRRDDGLASDLRQAIALAQRRSPFQDAVFLVDQLVEVAVRALSPGVNDPFTAENCIDRLGQALCRVGGRPIPSPFIYDGDRRLRVILCPVEFGDLMDAAFDRIREYGSASSSVLSRALEMLGTIGRLTPRADEKGHVLRHLELLVRAGERKMEGPEDRAILRARFDAARAAVTGNRTASRDDCPMHRSSGRLVGPPIHAPDGAD